MDGFHQIQIAIQSMAVFGYRFEMVEEKIKITDAPMRRNMLDPERYTRKKRKQHHPDRIAGYSADIKSKFFFSDNFYEP